MSVAPRTGDSVPRREPGRRRVARGLWVWGPVVVWLGVIALTSGEIGARARSDAWVWRLLHEWLPSLLGMKPSEAAPSFLPWWVRKLAHIAEYAVLGALFARALRGSARVGEPRAGRFREARGLPAVLAKGLPLCAAVAIADELHQSTLASRTGSPQDVGYDVVGATLGLVVGWLVWRRE